MQADGVPGLPQFRRRVRRGVGRERRARAREVEDKGDDRRREPRLHEAVHKQRVRAEVIDLGEAALALARAVSEQREHADDALEDHELEQRGHARGRDAYVREQREVREHLRVRPRVSFRRARMQHARTHARAARVLNMLVRKFAIFIANVLNMPNKRMNRAYLLARQAGQLVPKRRLRGVEHALHEDALQAHDRLVRVQRHVRLAVGDVPEHLRHLDELLRGRE